MTGVVARRADELTALREHCGRCVYTMFALSLAGQLHVHTTCHAPDHRSMSYRCSSCERGRQGKECSGRCLSTRRLTLVV